MDRIQAIVSSVRPLDKEAMAAAAARQDTLTKPAGSLGLLETLAVRLAGITGYATPHIDDARVILMAADHGVAVEGVSAYPQEVTGQMLTNFLNGGAAISVLARRAQARVVVVDMGVLVPPPTSPFLVSRRQGCGTANFAIGPAMTRAQAEAAVEAGIEIALDQIAEGARQRRHGHRQYHFSQRSHGRPSLPAGCGCLRMGDGRRRRRAGPQARGHRARDRHQQAG